MNRLIIFLVRMRLGVRRRQHFQFSNQRSKTDRYYFTATRLMKIEGCNVLESDVSLNWLVNKECKINKF